MRVDDPRLAALAAETAGSSAIVSFVEESGDHRLFIAAALLEDGRLRHVHRKVHLPTYGLFDERRFFAAGDALRAVPSRLGVGIGWPSARDFWHLGTAHLLALDGAQILVNVSSSPGRDLAATHAEGLGTAASWRLLLRTYAQLERRAWWVFCNRVGVDESISFWGGSEVLARPASRSSRRPSTTRRSSMPTCRSPTCGASGSPALPAGRAPRAAGPGAGAESWPSAPGWRPDATGDPGADA